jgi:hypothetical protein
LSTADGDARVRELLVRVPEELTFGVDDPLTVVDRYYAPDFVQTHDGVRLDRDRLVQHARPARRNVVGLRTEVSDLIVCGDRFAARYTIRAEMRKGVTLVNEVFMLGRLAPDGRLWQVDSTSRPLPT